MLGNLMKILKTKDGDFKVTIEGDSVELESFTKYKDDRLKSICLTSINDSNSYIIDNSNLYDIKFSYRFNEYIIELNE